MQKTRDELATVKQSLEEKTLAAKRAEEFGEQNASLERYPHCHRVNIHVSGFLTGSRLKWQKAADMEWPRNRHIGRGAH